jgi:hypothetical protein
MRNKRKSFLQHIRHSVTARQNKSPDAGWIFIIKTSIFKTSYKKITTNRYFTSDIPFWM